MYTGFRQSLSKIVPKWLQNRAAFKNGFKILFAAATQLDIMTEYIVEAGYASFPGYSLDATNQQLDPTSAIPYLAQGRGLLQGEAETNAHFATRLIAWLDTWTNAGSDEILATEIQQYLGNTPQVTIVDRAGHWTTVASDGTVTTATAPWNWDSISNPKNAGFWSDLWIIVTPVEWAKQPTLVPVPGQGLGHAVGRVAVDAILTLVERWKGAHAFCVGIIWTYDSTLFTPANPTADGNYGRAWKLDGSGNVIPSRTSSARYWFPVVEG